MGILNKLFRSPTDEKPVGSNSVKAVERATTKKNAKSSPKQSKKPNSASTKMIYAKNVKEFIDAYVKYQKDISMGYRSVIRLRWCRQHKVSRAEFDAVYFKHPSWKNRKVSYSSGPHQERLAQHANDVAFIYNRRWTKKDMETFLKENDTLKDWELAKKLNRTIPSIQNVRRRVHLLKNLGQKVTVEKLMLSENKLKKVYGRKK